jgi:septal ring factor EnvC (AmiA/AmiB activator)
VARPPAVAGAPAAPGPAANKTDRTAAKKPPARPGPALPADAHRQRQLQGEQKELQERLARLKRELMAAEASRSDAADALAASEGRISRANRRLRELAEERAGLERQIEELQQRGRLVGADQTRQQAQLSETLRRHHQLTLRDPFRAFLAGENPAELMRDAEYYGYLGRAATVRIDELRSQRTKLERLQDDTREKRDELARIADDEGRARAQLVTEQARRRESMQRLSKQIAAQRQSIDKLERDEKRLASLIDRLSSVLAEQARRAAEREAARKRQEAAAAARPSRPAPSPPTAPHREPPPSTQFAQLRGRLPMPVAGEITGRFGTPRRVEGAGTAPTWKGIFIRAPEGAGVRAIAAGQVVFADWLRGFGNLMVIDHGEGYLSVYGNNESLLRNAGERVAVGDVVAAVGNTGGIEQTGLYFELRFQGHPFDPLKWVAAR